MAGDWIKMTSGLQDDPAVIGLENALDLEVDAILGKLYRLWTWADQHLEDGNAPNVTESWVDRYMGVSGFASALVQVGWLDINGHGITIPNFERHMGQSAKRRAVTAKRVARHRRNAGSATREEKRREEKKGDTPKAPTRKRAAKSYTEDFERFWKAYSARRREGKGRAFKAWQKDRNDLPPAKDDPETVIAAAAAWAEHWDRISKETAYIPHPSTWLADRRWEDELPTNAKTDGQPQRDWIAEARAEKARRLAERSQ